jgi:hypothetical protein
MTTPNTAQEPTPWTDERELDNAHFADQGFGPSGYARANDARTLERHLRRIVEALECDPFPEVLYHAAIRAAIQAAKEEIK